MADAHSVDASLQSRMHPSQLPRAELLCAIFGMDADDIQGHAHEPASALKAAFRNTVDAQAMDSEQMPRYRPIFRKAWQRRVVIDNAKKIAQMATDKKTPVPDLAGVLKGCGHGKTSWMATSKPPLTKLA